MRAEQIRDIAAASGSRLEIWTAFLRALGASDVAEIGVYRGAFAQALMRDCPDIACYYMVDPWRHLDDWNKPANKSDDVFERIRRDAMEGTQAYDNKRVVLQGRTVEVIDEIPSDSLDFAYVDGDHTLRGITLDLVNVYPKICTGGWIGGDDFSPSIWQHERDFEPTLVFPFAVHFAEAVGARIYGLPHHQFLIEKRPERAFEFVDLTGKYARLELKAQFAQAQGESPG